MDRFAFASANLLAGNQPAAAALEMTLSGGSFRFEEAVYVALCGAEMGAALEGAPAGNWVAFPVASGATLSFGPAAMGCRTYLAVHGGIDVPVVLGSRSTYVRAGVGGVGGRALAVGDILRIGLALPRRLLQSCRRSSSVEERPGFACRTAGGDVRTDDRHVLLLRVHGDRSNDRMYRLEGPAVRHKAGADILTDALAPGAVQVPGDGMPIVMMADCQTSGGYAKIGTVIGPDLRLLAQSRSGDTVHFLRCPEEEAVTALRGERAAYAVIKERFPGVG
jgi:biotin-dependent carboxylase-like uncharacterized protein